VVRAAALALTVLGLLIVAPANSAAQAPLRFAAAADCLTNPNCGPGLKRVYHVDIASVFVPLSVADGGIGALDDGVADVAVAFSSNPEVSRPDVVTLVDDRGMGGPDPIVPVLRAKTLRAYSASDVRLIRRRLDAASAVLTTRALRQLNQQTGDGRLPEAVGGEFIDANGLGEISKKRHGPRIVIGFQAFTENETLAYMYAEVLRSAGFRVKVKPIGGFRPEAVKALRRGRISMWPGYAGSLLAFLTGRRPDKKATIAKRLGRAVRKFGGRTAKFAPGEDRNLIVTKTDTAARLGLKTLSDAAKYWPAAP
jgi:glycine betaine/choline ABC-type transport system substrate-binding protein